MTGDLLRTAIFQRQLDGIAEEMGAALVRAAVSANIKEREDSSCALFDRDGVLLAQAAHIPVHLGSMQYAVQSVRSRGATAGQRWLVNDPFEGGTHLPDLTLVTVIAADDGTLLGYAAARAHHADVGGRVPGSMSPFASHIDDEGVVISATCVGTDAGVDEHLAAGIMQGMRHPDERMADLRAQDAALHVADRRVRRIVHSGGGVDVFGERCAELLEYGSRRARAALERGAPGTNTATRALELPGGREVMIAARVELADGRLTVDLSESGPLSATSLNCPRSVTDAAVMFCVRVAFDPDLPTSGGADRHVDIVTRPGSVVHATSPAAVSGGNVEVSSVIVDVVLDALGPLATRRADGQGTMNNLVFANANFSYYETIAGGQGASATGPGPSAVHVAMTNTRNTPVEVLELDYPLRVERYAVRRGSGGPGQQPGGDGVIRAIRVLEACTATLVGQRRTHPPRGSEGGSDGSPGAQFVNGEPVDGSVTLELSAGVVVEIHTPGGGGYGRASSGTDGL